MEVRFSNGDSFASPSLYDAAPPDGAQDLHRRVGDFFPSPKTRAVGGHTDRARIVIKVRDSIHSPCATKREGSTPMKTITCRQLGGPCDHELRAETADQVIKDQDRHLKQAIKDGDATHEQAREDMKNRWKHPKQSMDWYSGIKKAFAELAED
jgi:predicted small metal-binding protein